MQDTKFKIGDRVMVIKYGHLGHISSFQSGSIVSSAYDTIPSIVGKVGTISQATKAKGVDKYAIDGIEAKYAWYDNEQLVEFKLTIN